MEVKKLIAKHMQATLMMAKQMMSQRLAMMQSGMMPQNPQQQQNLGMQPTQQGQQLGQGTVAPITHRPKVSQGMPMNKQGSVNKVGPAGMPGGQGNALPV